MDSSPVGRALDCLGRGFDIAGDFRAKYCKGSGRRRLVVLNDAEKAELDVPGFGTFFDVPSGVKCDKGDRMRFKSDVLEFDQMCELFNHRSSIAGRIPSGMFNSMFGFYGSTWAQDMAETKFLAIDGYYISLFDLHIECKPLLLADEVVRGVPLSWDPVALARFIENYGTHIIVGVTVGGQDVIHVRQDQSSNVSPSELKQSLNEAGDQLFTGTCILPPHHLRSKDHRPKVPQAFNLFSKGALVIDGFTTMSCSDGVTVIWSRRGGSPTARSHCEWLLTVPSMPEVINFTFIPITSLLKGVPGTGFLAHAINLYLRYKPPTSELQYFFEFQGHKTWAPIHNDLPLGPSSNRTITTASLNFNLMGPKLFVNTTQVTVGRRPVTGMRLHLEGKKNNRLAVHLQHLLNVPAFIGAEPDGDLRWRSSETSSSTAGDNYLEPVQWKMFSHVCTAPVEDSTPWSSPDGGPPAFIVTGAQLYVANAECRSVLHLRLLFSPVPSCTVGQSRWEGAQSRSPFLRPSSGIMSTISMSFEKEKAGEQQPTATAAVVVDSGVFAAGPPVPVQEQRLLRFVDTTQVCMGPQDSPGHWMVTGAKLNVTKGKIKLLVKFSLLTLTLVS